MHQVGDIMQHHALAQKSKRSFLREIIADSTNKEILTLKLLF